LISHGVLLPWFHADLDCIVHTGESAGWANPAAEALACKIPLICIGNGTPAFAKHMETAPVLDEISPEEIGQYLQVLFRDSPLIEMLTENGRRAISGCTRERYSQELPGLCTTDGF